MGTQNSVCSVVFVRWACDKQAFVLGHSLDAWSCELISEVLNNSLQWIYVCFLGGLVQILYSLLLKKSRQNGQEEIRTGVWFGVGTKKKQQ